MDAHAGINKWNVAFSYPAKSVWFYSWVFPITINSAAIHCLRGMQHPVIVSML